MTTTLNASNSGSGGLVATADASGILDLQTAGTTAVTINASQNVTFAGTLTTASRGITAASMPAGSVLQVVQGNYSSSFSTTSSSYVSTGASATITPTSSTSKILAQVSGTLGNQVYNWLYATLYRGATNISTVGSTNPAGLIVNNSADYIATLNFQILDSPATTSATTYTLYIKGQGNSVRAQVDGMPTYITLIEVAA